MTEGNEAETEFPAHKGVVRRQIYIGFELLPEETIKKIKGGRPGTEQDFGMWGDFVREVDASGATVWEWHFDDKWNFDKFPLVPMAPRTAYAHANSLCFLPDGNILLTFRMLNTCLVIEKSSGNVIWSKTDPRWMGPHNAHVLDNGNFMIFGNGAGGNQPYVGSAVIEFEPKSDEVIWKYEGYPAHTFHSSFISGAQRLPNGNTLICEGMWGRLFEVLPDGEVVWEYISPYFVPDEPKTESSGTNSIFRAFRPRAAR